MPTAPSFNDTLSVGQAEAQARRPDLAFNDGDVSLAMLHAAAAMVDADIRFSAQAFRATFVDGATGADLTALVDDHYNIQRTAATAAQVTLSLSRTSGGGAGSFSAGHQFGTEFQADGSQIIYTLDAVLNVGAGDNGPFSVECTAVETGPQGNVAASTVTQIIDTPFDDTFTVTNTAVAGGGNNEESDEDLRARARQFFSTAVRGTLAALETGALEIATVKVASAVEDNTTGQVTVRVSDADGNSTAQMISDVTAELENWRCAGSSVTVVGGTQLLVDAILTLTVRAGFDVAAAAPTIIDAVETRIGKLKGGDTLFLDMWVAAAVSAFPDDILDVNLADSTGESTIVVGGTGQTGDPANVVPTIGQTIRAGAVTVV